MYWKKKPLSNNFGKNHIREKFELPFHLRFPSSNNVFNFPEVPLASRCRIRASTQNVSFRIVSLCLIHLMAVSQLIKPNLCVSLVHRRSAKVSLEADPFFTASVFPYFSQTLTQFYRQIYGKSERNCTSSSLGKSLRFQEDDPGIVSTSQFLQISFFFGSSSTSDCCFFQDKRVILRRIVTLPKWRILAQKCR